MNDSAISETTQPGHYLVCSSFSARKSALLLVGWIWIGALIAVAGAVMAGWPALESRRRMEAAYRARLGKELGTAQPPPA